MELKQVSHLLFLLLFFVTNVDGINNKWNLFENFEMNLFVHDFFEERLDFKQKYTAIKMLQHLHFNPSSALTLSRPATPVSQTGLGRRPLAI